MNAYIGGGSTGTLTLIYNGKAYTLNSTHSNYAEVLRRVKSNDWTDLDKLLDIKRVIIRASRGKFQVRNDGIFYGDVQLHGVIIERIMEFMEANEPFDPLLAFLENLMQNPSKNSVDQLYTFLEHKHLPVTSDGCFLAYKAVRSDWLDKYSGKILNTIGSIIEMARNFVDDDKERHCSYGYHVGSLDYVRWYGGSDSRYLICKVNPRDVVSVPTDHNFQKVRVCRYEVVEEYAGELPNVINVTKDNLVSYSEFLNDSEDDYDWNDDTDCDDFDICPECGTEICN